MAPVRLDCSGILFGSPLDEKHLFEWAMEIPCVVRWDGDTLVVKSIRLSREDLCDLIALFHRYGVPMRQLAQFSNAGNRAWFEAPHSFWHPAVFGKPADGYGRPIIKAMPSSPRGA